MCSNSLAIKGINIKTTKRYHYTGATLTKIRRIYNIDISKDEETLELVSRADEGVHCCNYFEKLFNRVY